MANLATTDTQTSSEISSSEILSALGFGRGDGFKTWSTTDISYTLQIGNKPPGEQTGTWDPELTAAYEAAMADISSVCNVNFTEVSTGADIDMWSYTASDGYLGYSYGISGDGVFINESSLSTDGLTYGGYDYITVIHELLHNMGLAHPHDSYADLPGVSNPSDTGNYALNQNVYTVMSYNDIQQVDANGDRTTGWGTAAYGYSVMGAFDIAMLQTLYGVNTTTATGNDTYILPSTNEAGTYYNSIWDAGGTDLFLYTGSDDVIIDLRAATLNLADGMLAGGGISSASGIYGGYTIANGAVIENATGGSGNDTLIGNDVRNVLKGNNGSDTLTGGNGLDTLRGGNQNDALFGDGGHDVLVGGSGADSLVGGASGDILIGGAGNDILTGGTGADVFVFNTGSGDNTVTDFSDGSDIISVGFGANSFADISVTQSGSDTLVAFSDTSIILTGINAADITESDFLFA